VMAAYRIDHDGWDNLRALREAMDRGMGFYQLPRQNFIRAYRTRNLESAATPTGVQSNRAAAAPQAP
jgi:hypothetical protein